MYSKIQNRRLVNGAEKSQGLTRLSAGLTRLPTGVARTVLRPAHLFIEFGGMP
jgi:hypothetical protein